MIARTKPITVEAVQWRGDNEAELIAFFPLGARLALGPDHVLVLSPAEIRAGLFLNDWVVRNARGEGYSLYTHSEFSDAFDLVEPPEENEGSD